MDQFEQAKIDRDLDALIADALNDTDVLALKEQANVLRDNIREVQGKRISAAVNARISQGKPEAKQFVSALTDIAKSLVVLKRDLRGLEDRIAAEAPEEPVKAPEQEAVDTKKSRNGASAEAIPA